VKKSNSTAIVLIPKDLTENLILEKMESEKKDFFNSTMLRLRIESNHHMTKYTISESN